MAPRALRLPLLLVPLLAVAACHGTVNVVSANSDTVTIRHTPSTGGEAANEAERYCAQYNKKARLRSSAPEPTNEQYTIYDCVPL